MTLRHGRPQVAIPGPSIIPERVLAAMQRSMPNIYDGSLVEVSNALFTDLPRIARTDGEVFIVIGNGHAAWQMAVSNTMRRGKLVLVLESGTFARAWGEQAALSGADTEVLPGIAGSPVDADAVKARLRSDVDHEIDAILVVLTDTASSVRNDIPSIRRAIDAAGHPALLMVDAIASLGCEPYEMDEWGVDVTIAASQKGLMTPPGLGFVWANDKALAAHDRADMRVGYLDWTSRRNVDAHYQLYNGTPPISHIYALREALDMIFEEGLENAWHRHEVLARSVWAAIDAWDTGDGTGLRCHVADPESRSHAVTTVWTGATDADRLRQVCESEAGLTLGLASAQRTAPSSGSGTWDTSIHRCCSARSARSRQRCTLSALPSAGPGSLRRLASSATLSIDNRDALRRHIVTLWFDTPWSAGAGGNGGSICCGFAHLPARPG